MPLSIWTIYDHPSDFPDGYALREWVIDEGANHPGEAIFTTTLEDARLCLPPGLYCLPRDRDDDSTIVENWI